MEEQLRQLAESGDTHAQLKLSMLLDQRGHHGAALELLKKAAQPGNAEAQFLLGARLLVGRAAPYDPDEGARWISAAARQGMPQALSLMSVLALVSGDWAAAAKLMSEAALRGDARAREQMAILGDGSKFDWERWRARAEPDWQFHAPRIGIITDFLPEVFCDWLVRRARPGLEPVRVKDPRHGGGMHADYRSNQGAGFGLLDSDLIIQMINRRIADATGVPLERQEPTNVLRYRPGEEYRPHNDYISATERHEEELRLAGQRTTTFLVYLNDDYEGGETSFPQLDWRFKGRRGDALVFWNVTADGDPDPRTLHAGLPPTSGEKWLLSKWIRARPYPLI